MVSRIAVIDQPSALTAAGGSPACWRFQATRQRAEQNRACSRRGANNVPPCSHFRVSVITLPRPMLRVTSVGAGLYRDVIEQFIVAGDVPAGGDRPGPALGHHADQAGRTRLAGSAQRRMTTAEHAEPGVLLQLGTGV